MNSIRILFFSSLFTAIVCVYIEKNGYKGVTISFSETGLDSSFDLGKLKTVLKDASALLFHASRRRAYFEEFVLVVPEAWSDNSVCDKYDTEAPKNIDIYVTDLPDVSEIKTQHSRGCGEKGDIMYLPKGWLAGRTEDLALQFIRQWSTFRYGVFSENPERNGSCTAKSDSAWSPTGCYNIDLEVEINFDENGLPVCSFPEDFERDHLNSSIMFSAHPAKMLDFCDGSESFPHNPIAPTLHNRICEGNSLWSVIKHTDDFKYGRNLPMNKTNLPKSPKFRCFKESKTHLTIMVQDTDSEARTEIRYALFYFLSIIEPGDYSLSLATFSSSAGTVVSDFINVNLQDKANLKQLLDSRIKLNEKVSNPCLTCGLRKALNVSQLGKHSLRTVVVLARESSLESSTTAEVLEIMKTDENAVLHFLFLADTATDIIPSSLVDSVQNCRGRLFRIKNEPVSMLSELTTALLDASKNILHIEDKILVVHRKTYVDAKSDITDTFSTPKDAKGELLYTLQFKKRGDMKPLNDSCSDLDSDLQSPICGNKTFINGQEDSAKVWEYSFKYVAGSEGTTCSSLALLKLQSSSNLFTVRGWLNTNKITPGLNTLIIYAEVCGIQNEDVRVEAKISGPGLDEFSLELRDNGNGDPDIIKGDNIFSRYFTSYPQKGSYVVSIHVEAFIKGKKKNLGEENSAENKMSVTQTKVIDTFRVTESPPAEDIFPPNRISDLRVASIDSSNGTVSIQWTAPGDDYDYGKAKTYIIKASTHWMTLLDFTFNLQENILLETGLQPAFSGITETIGFRCPAKCDKTYYVALRALDNSNNEGKISNIIQIPINKDTATSNDGTETSRSHSLGTDPSVSTEKIQPTDSETTDGGNRTIIPANQTSEKIFFYKKAFVIASSSFGTLILILIILNIAVCWACFRRKNNSEETKKQSEKASLRPPYNLNIAYNRGSVTTLGDENSVSNLFSELVDHRTKYPSSGKPETLENRYTYHTERSLSIIEDQNKKNDLGFNVVQPAYATSSLSCFVTKGDGTDKENTSTKGSNLRQQAKQTENAQIYSLGHV